MAAHAQPWAELTSRLQAFLQRFDDPKTMAEVNPDPEDSDLAVLCGLADAADEAAAPPAAAREQLVRCELLWHGLAFQPCVILLSISMT